MSLVKFYSDPHFGHELVSILRGFDSIHEHDEFIIDQWNSVTNKRDVVWLLGDISMHNKKVYPLLNRLNGMKRIILGNHDDGKHVRSLLSYDNILSVAGVVKTKIDGEKMLISHIPVHPMELNYRVSLNIHGHLHTGRVFIGGDKDTPLQIDPRYICASAERIDFKPKTFEELMDIESMIDPINEVKSIKEISKKNIKQRNERVGSRKN